MKQPLQLAYTGDKVARVGKELLFYKNGIGENEKDENCPYKTIKYQTIKEAATAFRQYTSFQDKRKLRHRYYVTRQS